MELIRKYSLRCDFLGGLRHVCQIESWMGGSVFHSDVVNGACFNRVHFQSRLASKAFQHIAVQSLCIALSWTDRARVTSELCLEGDTKAIIMFYSSCCAVQQPSKQHIIFPCKLQTSLPKATQGADPDLPLESQTPRPSIDHNWYMYICQLWFKGLKWLQGGRIRVQDLMGSQAEGIGNYIGLSIHSLWCKIKLSICD